MGDKVNNWEAAKELHRFKVMYLDPAINKFKIAENIMKDPNTKMTADVKKRSQEKLKKLEGEMINLSRLYSAVMELITQHEELTDMLTEIYSDWSITVAYKGTQPTELLSNQAKILQDIFQKINVALEPLGLELSSPKSLKP